MNYKVLIFFGLIFFIPAFFGQQLKVYNEFLEPVEQVEIVSLKTLRKVETNEKGSVNIKAFKDDDTLSFYHQLYKPKTISVKTIKNKLNYIVLLEYESVFLDSIGPTITVRAKRIKLERNPVKIDVLNHEKLHKIGAQTSAEILEQASGVAIQKSQSGGGSPIIRGMEANKVLLVIDGVRMNNAIYRGGHLQNSITIDNNILDQIDVSYGPGSVNYGSDALGGVIHYYTKNPLLKNTDSSLHFRGVFYTAYASGNDGKNSHLDFSLSKNKWGSLTSISYKDFGDIKMGKNRTHGYQDWGIVRHKRVFENGVDKMITNLDTNTQLNTGYNQLDLLQKIVYNWKKNVTFTLNTQYSTSSNINRYDQLTKYKNNHFKYAEWYYGPQNRLLTAFTTTIKGNYRFFNNATIIVSYQNIEESRITRKWQNLNRIKREEKVQVGAVNLDFSKTLQRKTKLYYGAETTHNIVNSNAIATNISTAESVNTSTRYPDDGSTMTTGALYANITQTYEKLLWNFGNRLTFTSLEANFKDTSFIHLPFDKITAQSQAFSSSFGLVLTPVSSFKINTNLSSGFRTPNIDDFGKVFEKNDYVVIPNNKIKPEFAYTGELGISKTFRRNFREADSTITRLHFATVSATGYYTLLDNLIVKTNYQLNGNDSILYEGEMKKIQANTNIDNGYIYGVSGGIKVSFNQHIKLNSTLNYTVGRATSTQQPLAHIQPLFGKTSLVFDFPKWDIELYSKYNGKKDIADYAPNGLDNDDEATVDGTPSWYTLNIRGGYQFSSKISTQVSITNIMDVHYKRFSSGISAMGRSFNASLRILF